MSIATSICNTHDRLPPHNIDAEIGTIASMLLDPECIPDVQLIVKPSDFFRSSHEVICRSIFTLVEAGLPVDSITLEDHLQRIGELESAGGVDAILDIQASEPDSASARYWAQIVVEKSIARDVIVAANEILGNAYSLNRSADQLLSSSEHLIEAIGESRERSESVSLSVAAGVELENILGRRGEEKIPGITFGLKDLDTLIGGFRGPQLIVVAARPSMGKTALALQLGLHATQGNRERTLFASLEMTTAEIATRSLAFMSQIKGGLQHASVIEKDDETKLRWAAYEMGNATPLIIDDSASLSVSQISAQARRLKARSGGLGLVVVDYIQLVDPAEGKDPRQEQVARISRELKKLARVLRCPVVALSQLNRSSESREDRRPRMSDLRESGAIEQDADIVLLLHRPDYYDGNDRPGQAEVNVAKNRNGDTGTVLLTFNREQTRFSSFSSQVPDEAAY